MARAGHDRAGSDHRLAPQERLDDAAPQRGADERAVAVAVEQVAGREHALVAEVDDREVGVEARLEPALAGETEPLGRGCTRQRRNGLERQAALLGDRQQRGPERLAARDAAPYRERVVTLLQIRRRRRVVGGDERDRAREQLRPERLDLGARPQRRRALGERADAAPRPRP